MMKVITLLNEKGGVGKTTLSVTLGVGLAIMGANVLLIDTDSQGSLTASMGMKLDGGLYNLLVKDWEWNEVIAVPNLMNWAGDCSPKGGVTVLRSNLETRAIPMLVEDPRELSMRIDELKGFYDVVVIDTSPTPSLLHSMIYAASDYILIPTQTAQLSIDGLKSSQGHLQNVSPMRKVVNKEPTKLLGTIPTMYRSNTIAHQHGLKKIEGQFGDDVWDPICDRIVWGEASFARQSIFAYAPDSPAAEEAWQMVRRVQAEVLR